MLIIPCLLVAQPQVSKSNNTRTLLGSSATFNGAIEAITGDYNWLVVVIKANKNSAIDGIVVRWSASNALPITYTTIDKRTYTANDTLNGANVYRLPIAGAYYKVSYTNTSVAQTGTFSLTTYLVKSAWDVNALSTEASLLVLLGYQHPFTISTGTTTTVSTEVDTTVFTSTVKQTFGVFAVNDTLEISLSGTFTDAKIVYPYMGFTFENFDPTTFTKGYIRRYGGTGTVTYVLTSVGY